MMYAWATPEYVLDKMSMEQAILFYQKGMEAKKTDAVIFWGVLGQALRGSEGENIQGLEKFKELHPDGILKDGAWEVSR
ncbi:hypothetical protein [Methanosarcina acetivorans]|uniref:Uncharacterized protein n=1 Tax=Methanosarcina acetivorans (strain ATCC 35395 / DSM 2834 / JCM 12185 / C2A) TaxID=188937 RepID=Q8TJH8_METAC|nr:hypothetical protein [Methanosarcina acetivorans]AAM07157.1 predicted protein [Methanosarcina acetivorans C2A]